MRKISIGFISPYDAMVPMIEELKQGQTDLEISAEVGNLEKGVSIAKEMEKQGTDIIISRGGTAKLIRDAVLLPVIDVHMSGYDLMRSIMLANDHSEEKKALVGFSNITIGAASIVSLLEIDMEVVTLTDASEVETILTQLKEAGYTRILGDVVTVNAAARHGLNGLLIQSGREAILQSFEEARRLFKTLKKNQQLLRVLGQLVTEREQDFMIAAESGIVLFENWLSFERLPIASEELESLKKQVLEEGSSVLRVINDAEFPFSVQVNSWQDRNELLFSFFFKRISASTLELYGGKAEEINQLPQIVTESKAMKNIKQLIEEPLLAAEPVILVGKAGTGKQTIARYIHAYHEKKGYFVSLSIEELKKSFGELHSLNTSTLFLIVNKVSAALNVYEIKELLTIMAAQKVQVILSTEEMPSELAEALELHEAIRIILPDLNDRQEDIEFLVRQFLTEFHQSLGTQPIKVRDDAMEELKQIEWNGHLNELKAYIKKLALAEKDYVIEKSALQKTPVTSHVPRKEKGFIISEKDTLKTIERKIIELILQEEGYNQTKAAKRLGINRATLWRKLKS
ncbi:PrpR N-terminal domain-containing protein [Planococcus shenhongbingii]|uniref:sigma-54-dependent transcriptional regulator n=1 Tax=Planococcus shenhongbingii TaxID=3058398 RepID=UPI002608E667|nr:sigma-54-dependent transcriptional regulator [Planococcus sp. N016]WKA57678.1 PrpR N-terminal domain-containing protein [Planococcus sp. N016]